MPPQRKPLVLAGTILLFVGVGIWLVLFPAKPGSNPPLPKDDDAVIPIRPMPAEGIKLKIKQLADTPPEKVSPANAADLYRQAFTLIDGLSSNDLDIVKDLKSTVDPAMAADLCVRVKPICALAHEATTTTNCDWGVSNTTLNLQIPYLPNSQPLAFALIWNAAHCRQGDSAGIGDDLAAVLHLAQAVAKPPLLISHFVNLAMQRHVIDFLADNATTLPNDVSARVTKLLADDDSAKALAGVWESEAIRYNGAADKFATMSPAEAQVALRNLVGDNAAQYSRTQAIAALRLAAELTTEYAQMLVASDPEYQTWLNRSKGQRQANPLIDLLLPTGDDRDTVLAKTQAMAVKRALLAAGLAYLQGDPDALDNHPDPTSSTPFIARQTDAGLELKSTYIVNNEPLTMFFPNHQASLPQ